MNVTLKTTITNSSLPSPESELLLAFLLKKKREFILTHPERKININNYQKFKGLEKKRLVGYSIAHLLGEKEFFGLTFKVNKDTLVPRPLTELIVEEVLSISRLTNTKLNIIDIGTGTGAIIISIAKELKKNKISLFKKTKFFATDISRPALKMAQENIKRHRLEKTIKIYQGDLMNALKKLDFTNQELIITANLPYLSPKKVKTLTTIQKEPKTALEGGFDGLRLYQKLFKQLNKSTYQHLTCICEFDSKQKAKILTIAKKEIKNAKFRFKKDLANKTRFMIITR